MSPRGSDGADSGSARKKTGKKVAKKKATAARKAPKATVAKPDAMPEDVLEFITAIDDYKRIHQRPFPTWSEVLEILKGLGYGRAC